MYSNEQAHQIIRSLSRPLMIEIKKKMSEKFFRSQRLFEKFSEDLRYSLIPHLREQQYLPGQYIEDGESVSLYYVSKGSLSMGILKSSGEAKDQQTPSFLECRALREGDSFGQEAFLNLDARRYSIQTNEFVTLMRLERSKFLETLRGFPRDYEIWRQILDETLVNGDNQYLQSTAACESCHQATHMFYECPVITLDRKMCLRRILQRSLAVQKRPSRLKTPGEETDLIAEASQHQPRTSFTSRSARRFRRSRYRSGQESEEIARRCDRAAPHVFPQGHSPLSPEEFESASNFENYMPWNNSRLQAGSWNELSAGTTTSEARRQDRSMKIELQLGLGTGTESLRSGQGAQNQLSLLLPTS